MYFGPQATPPMVTAGAPMSGAVGAPTAPMDQTQLIAQLLKRRAAATQQAQMAAGNSEMWGSQFQNPQFTQNVRGSGSAPDQTIINYGDILGKGVANFMQGRERKAALSGKQEVADINSEFMKTTLASDPEAQKLYGAVQAGIPGADKALAEHLSPKKNSMAVLVQGITSGAMDPDLAYSIAGQFGLDPEVVKRAAAFAVNRKDMQATDKFGQQVVLQGMKNEATTEQRGSKMTPSGYTQAELAAMPPAQRIEAVRAASGRESAQSKATGKAKAEAMQELPQTEYAMTNIKRVMELAKKADYWPGNLGLKGDKMTTNPNNVNLRQALAQLTLDANGGKLGAGFSNADRDFMREAQTNLESGNVKTVTYQLQQLIDRLESRQKLLRKTAGVDEPESASVAPNFDELFPAGTFEGE